MIQPAAPSDRLLPWTRGSVSPRPRPRSHCWGARVGARGRVPSARSSTRVYWPNLEAAGTPCSRTDEWAVECGVSAAPLRGRAGRRPWGSDQRRTEPEDLLRKRRPRQVARSCLGRDRRLCALSKPGAATWDLAGLYPRGSCRAHPGRGPMRPGPGPPARAFVISVQGGWGSPLSPGLPWPLRELGSHWGWGLAPPTTSGWPSAQCPLWLDPPEPACPLGMPRALASVSQEFGGPQG